VTCAVARSLGVYVLDALDAAERESVARHVERCPHCRRELEAMAPLPALLASVPIAAGARATPAARPSRRRSSR
jgi:anti-sigma factor RsiW